MKQTIVPVRIILYILFVIGMLTSCKAARKMQEDISNSRDKEKGNFVQLKDGTEIKGEELKTRYPIFKKATVQIDNGEKVNLRDVVVMQTDAAYYRRISGQLAPRIKKGGINTYVTYETRQDYTGGTSMGGTYRSGQYTTRTVAVYHIQKTDSGQVMSFTPQNVGKMVADYRPANDIMDAYRFTQKKVKTYSIINTVAVFGGIALAGIAGGRNGKTNAAAYVGGGLFFGGTINGFVNKFRRVKNYKKLELAIDEYNYGYKKRKR